MLVSDDKTHADSPFDAYIDIAENLGMFPEVAREIQQISRTRGASVRDLERIVGRDVALTARLLRLANSPYYGGRRTVSTLRHALVVIGFLDASQLSLAFAMSSVALRKEASRQVMRHGARTAIIARELARHTRGLQPSEAFVAGMLHDLGEVVLLETLGPSYQAVCTHTALPDRQRLRAERAIAGIDHAALTERCLSRWRFAYSTTLAVRHHHQPVNYAAFEGRSAFSGDSLVGLADWVETELSAGMPRAEVADGLVCHPFNDALCITQDHAAAALNNIELELADRPT